ncbi:hypothetical protein CO009_01235 [Candidatus Shapirobacteria bacterium CG_4_8_14_3_um_filter_35_11]|uniref:LysM domain-containing protein n=5 Tax=Candidatus Shapironibacteriota TaxID=1752721 RepID=A0A1J5I958_9BACT|nr:MAG: hypothetical protein AUK05_00470 [Candidatus Shapirobacteria bacterium CG2_30_35_20]PIX68367.1 MAG: hypothetical protein COZ41_00060 [Candidatus Shapirobacteria bacterium CG_4_10_14_3_um_filter_35_13]PJA51278.1 MAG: hypothetical protein CO168_00605 [Candidatus Shapirobacteria bacterium CG_4_9_14_3_um_filter_36_12]PJC80728.1 MAG: hypothetical protein CO009_01235 [Candidatus Shapirobacteria bacterium CG_4_8_14_3_um_filter_35_11]PJE66898.1 MAG: hypothetical protein COU93_01740 [Candidatus 
MNKNIFPESREELVSMFLGLGVVIVAVLVIFNFVIKSKGNISLPGISTKTEQNLLTTPGKINNIDSGLYEVIKGDSLWNIAVKKYGNGFLWTKIASENKLINVSVIEVGQKLVLPVISEAEIKSAPKPIAVIENYKVRVGDSLWKIATSQLGSGYKWTQIWNLNKNKIGNPDRLEIGMMLKLR